MLLYIGGGGGVILVGCAIVGVLRYGGVLPQFMKFNRGNTTYKVKVYKFGKQNQESLEDEKKSARK